MIHPDLDGVVAGKSEIIRRTATNTRYVVLFIVAGLFLCCLGALNLGFDEMAGRWLVRQLGWIALPENANTYFMIAGGSFAISALLWLFNGNGNRAFRIAPEGITRFSSTGSILYPWAAFDGLERNVGSLTLHLADPEPGLFSTRTVTFDLAGLDVDSTALEALIVYYRPDLFSARSQFGVALAAAV